MQRDDFLIKSTKTSYQEEFILMSENRNNYLIKA